MKEMTVSFASDNPYEIALVTTFWMLITADKEDTDVVNLGPIVSDNYGWLLEEIHGWLPAIIEKKQLEGQDATRLIDIAKRLGFDL